MPQSCHSSTESVPDLDFAVYVASHLGTGSILDCLGVFADPGRKAPDTPRGPVGAFADLSNHLGPEPSSDPREARDLPFVTPGAPYS